MKYAPPPLPPRPYPSIPKMVALLLLALAAPAAAAGDPTTARPDEATLFFRNGVVPTLKITVDDAGLATWKTDPRAYVKCSVKENEKALFEGVGVKLKGAVGSFRNLDDKPGLTLRFAKFGGDVDFHGMEKVYLNNSVQDDTYLHEWLGSELFRAAGLAAPRVTHARVWLNGRDIGLHVLKEGHDKRFLRRNFEDPNGTLYDSGLGQDIDSELERDEGKGPNDHKELQDLLYACEDMEPARARPGILAHLDVDRFITFMAMERMIGHWDGYCWNRNNYRLYFDKSHKAAFIPHGMDQLFADADLSIFDEPVSIVGLAVMRDAEWAAAYYKKIGELLPLFLPVEKWAKRFDEVAARVKPAAAGTPGPQPGPLKTRFAARVKSLTAQAKLPAPEPLALAKGDSFKLRSWRPVAGKVGGMKVQQATLAGDRVLRFECAPKGDAAAVGTWRTKVFLAPGRYRLQASVLTENVAPVGAAGKGGVWMRVEGGAESEHVDGSSAWKPLEVEFDAGTVPNRVELVLEMRASKGEASFRLGSLKISRVDG